MEELELNRVPDEVKKLLDEGRWPEAIEALDRILKANPGETSLWRAKANVYVAMSRPYDALACYERMLAIDPQDAVIHAEKAEVLESLDDHDEEALASYDRALELASSNVSFLNAKAQLLARLQRVEESLAVYERILTLRPRDPDSLIAKGDALIYAGQVDRAAGCFEQAAAISPESFGAGEWAGRADTLARGGQAEKALEFYQRAVRIDAKYAWAFAGMARVLSENLGRTEEALRWADQAIAIDPKNAWFQIDKGNVHYQRQEYKDAAGCYAKALDLDPKSQVAWRNLGLAQEFQGQYDQALVSAEKTIELDPGSADAWLHKGYCLGRMSRLEESITAYQEALRIEPENFWSNNNMGWNLFELGRYQEALRYCDTAIKVDPTIDSPWSNKAKNLRELHLYSEAIETAREGLKVVKDKFDLLTIVGYTYSESLFEHDKALEFYEQALQLDTSNVQLRMNIAECLIKAGQYERGRKEAERLIGQLPDRYLECDLSLVILASYVLEGDEAARAKQFAVVAEHLKSCCPEDRPGTREIVWDFGGLVNTIRASKISEEAKFLVLTAIDVKQGNLARKDMSFFQAGRAAVEPAPAEPAPAARQAAS